MAGLNEAWEIFKKGVSSILRQWTALQLAVVRILNIAKSGTKYDDTMHVQDNNWGGGDSHLKASRLESELIDMFRVRKHLYRDEVEDFLVAFLDDNFGTYAEDER